MPVLERQGRAAKPTKGATKRRIAQANQSSARQHENMLQVDSYSRAMQQTYQPKENEVRYKYFSGQSFPESYLLIGLTKPTHMKRKIANCFAAAAAPFLFPTIQQVLHWTREREVGRRSRSIGFMHNSCIAVQVFLGLNSTAISFQLWAVRRGLGSHRPNRAPKGCLSRR